MIVLKVIIWRWYHVHWVRLVYCDWIAVNFHGWGNELMGI